MKSIVTGANGFVGSHLVERLFRHGQQVVCLVRPGCDMRWLRGLPVEICTDGLDSADGLAKVIAGAEFVFHVAGMTRGRSQGEYLAANVEPTRRLIEAAGRCAGTIGRFVYVSSMAAVGPNRGDAPVDETCEAAPIDDYGRSKLAAEQIVREAGAAGRLAVTIVRPPGVYGPRDTNFLPLFRAARRWGILPAIGGPAKQFTLVHVDDLVEGIWLAASSPVGVGQTYFIGGGTYTTGTTTTANQEIGVPGRQNLAVAMSAAIGRPLRVLNVPRPLAVLAGEFGQLKWALTGRPQIMSRRKIRDLLQPRWTCSWEKARGELGYREQVSLADGFRATAVWYGTQGWVRTQAGK
jgi:nucleoside-diphosphate-sugar epimerase